MICRHYKNGQKLDVAGLNKIVVLIDRSETELTEVALNSWRPGLDGPPHAHEQKEQIFFITSGGGSVKIGHATFTAEAGDLFYIPAGVIHQTITRREAPLEYLLFNAFANSAKEGHASFADHIAKVKNTRKLQARTQRAGAGLVPASQAKGRHLHVITGLNPLKSKATVRTQLLNRARTGRCKVACIFWPAEKSSVPKTHPGKEETLFILNGTGKIAVGGESKTVTAGDVIFIPRNTACAIRTDAEGLTGLSLCTLIPD